jgi:hypothetical protein
MSAADTSSSDQGEPLATFERDQGRAKLCVTLDSYEGHPYLTLRLWRRDASGCWKATTRETTVRLSEAPRLAEVLVATAASGDRQSTGAVSVPRSQPLPRRPLSPERESPLPAPPPPPPDWLLALGRAHTGPPVPIRGSPKQVTWVERLRQVRLVSARCRAPELVGVLSVISDAGWWIAHAETPLTEVRWPTPEQTGAAAAPAEEFNGRSTHGT